jgi:hypothetical protein
MRLSGASRFDEDRVSCPARALSGSGAGLAWVEIFKTSGFEGYSGMLVFFGFMPGGAMIGAIAGALLFAMMAVRDNEIAIKRDRVPRNEH